MNKSDLRKEIKNYIYEILSEKDIDEGTYVGKDAVDDLQRDPKFAATQDKVTPVNTLKSGGSVTLEEEDEKEDTWNKEDKEDKRPEDKEPSKAELAKEKVKTVSKFKVPTSDFDDFKTKLKTLVKKIKDMEKGAERDKKMAALKQFIKKPELVKAFKERDVQVDTGGLVGENKIK